MNHFKIWYHIFLFTTIDPLFRNYKGPAVHFEFSFSYFLPFSLNKRETMVSVLRRFSINKNQTKMMTSYSEIYEFVYGKP